MMDKTKNNLLILCRFLDKIISEKPFGMYDCACFPFQYAFLLFSFMAGDNGKQAGKGMGYTVFMYGN